MTKAIASTDLLNETRMISLDIPLGTRIEVTWVDSGFEVGWIMGSWGSRREQIAPLNVIKTLGYLTAVTDELIEVSGSISDNKGLLNPLVIPKGCIRNITCV